MAQNKDTPADTAPPAAPGVLQTEMAVGIIVIGAILALAAIRASFRSAVIEIGS